MEWHTLKYMKHIRSTITLLLAVCLLFSSSVGAQSVADSGASINLTVSPTFVNLVADPGEKVSTQFAITNNNSFTESYRLSLVKYELTDGGNSLSIVDVAAKDPVAKWITFPESAVAVSANQTKTIKLTVQPDKDATLGYYYGILIERDKEALPKDQTAVAAASVFSVILEINTPDAHRELNFVDFSTDKLIYEHLPTTFNVTVKNTGNIHVVPVGNVFIDQGKSKDLALLSVNPGRGNVLPQSSRTFTTQWDDGFIVRSAKMENGNVVLDEKNNPVMTTTYNFEKFHKFRIGKYTAHLLLIYDNGQRDIPIEARLSFWVIPWKMIGAATIIVLFVLLGLRSVVMGIMGSSAKRGK